MTPSFSGLTATMLAGVLPSIILASSPTARILFVSLLIATTDGSLRTTPFPLIYTSTLAVPKSIPTSSVKPIFHVLLFYILVTECLHCCDGLLEQLIQLPTEHLGACRNDIARATGRKALVLEFLFQ